MTAIGGLGHALPFLIPGFTAFVVVTVCIVALELAVISFIRYRFMKKSFIFAVIQVVIESVGFSHRDSYRQRLSLPGYRHRGEYAETNR
jgi:hypothetical protein